MATVQTRFDCAHITPVDVNVDADVRIPDEVRGLGKCRECMDETNLVPITGVQPTAAGELELDSVFWMPIE